MLTKWGWKNFHLKVKMKGGGGGGSAGIVGYPAYLEDWHCDLAKHCGASRIAISMTDVMNAALGNDPYTGEIAYNPDADITAYEAAVTAFAALLAGINEPIDWAVLFTQAETSIGSPTPVAAMPDVGVIGDIVVADIADTVDVDGISEAEIVADVDAFADQLDDEITTKVLPRFEAGMLNINAVASSAYAIGKSTIEGFRNREVAKHASTLRLAAEYKNADMELENVKLHLDVRRANVTKTLEVERANLDKDIDLEKMSTEIKKINASIAIDNAKAIIAFHSMYIEGSSQMLNFLLSKYAWEESYMKVVIEGKRIKIVAKKEEADMNLDIDESAATWDLNVFQHGANLLASIGGGVHMPNERKKNAIGSALGGALSGAAAGAMYGATKGAVVGSGWGAVIGAVLGAAVGYLSA